MKTYSPSGVNVEDSVWRTPYSFICDICITFYGIAWILVRQWPFKDTEFGNDFLGLFGNTFRFGLAVCGSRFGIFYALFICLYCFFLFFVIFLSFFIYLYCFFFLFCYFSFCWCYCCYFFSFYTERVFVGRFLHRCFRFSEY